MEAETVNESTKCKALERKRVVLHTKQLWVCPCEDIQKTLQCE